MQEHEIWLTRLFNDHLAGLGNTFLGWVGMPAEPRPWANFITMQLLVVALILILFAVLRTRLSADRPGNFQQTFELIYQFVRDQAEAQLGHHQAHRYLVFFGVLFVFILFSNLIGIIPGFESPTMYVYVPTGCAVATFLFYNAVGIREVGLLKYLKHFAGPIWWLAWLMVPIEIFSHLARPLSLTLRLFANMFAGEQVLTIFLGLTKLVVPVVFMGLHIFVALLQAYIFMLLTMIYVGSSITHEGEH
jgi:F-type H+-transporting ATPase subunit a